VIKKDSSGAPSSAEVGARQESSINDENNRGKESSSPKK
jgi:hypothetical protein